MVREDTSLAYLKETDQMKCATAKGYEESPGSNMAEFNKPTRDVYQVGDEIEVEVLRSFNWPLSELIMEDGVLPKRGIQKPKYKARLVDYGFTQRAVIDYNESPRQWYRKFDEYMLSNGFKRSSIDSCVYYKSYASREYIYLLLYVENILIACKSKAEIGSTKSLLKKEFDMKELGEAKKILGMEIIGDRIRKILRCHNPGGQFKLSLKDCPVSNYDVERMSKVPYANAFRSLMYLMVCTRSDISYAVSVVSRYLVNPSKIIGKQ
nr:retrotransposon protein, putative, Ty1-copia subclass [Tanacetum cinerariifolium]